MTTLTWLHLSDFHFEADPKDERPHWRRDRVMAALADQLPDLLNQASIWPDAVFVTGDIAHSGKADEYREAAAFFKKLGAVLKLDPKRHWFVAPGNHDVDRASLNLLDKKTRLHLNEEEAGALLDDQDIWAQFAARQTAFFEFAKKFLGAKRAWNPKTPWKTELFPIGSAKEDAVAAILCLNTAWASQDDEDDRKIMLGERQVQAALDEANQAGAGLKIALMHHPLADLAKFDAQQCGSLLKSPQGCQFILHGHLHQTSLEQGFTPSAARFELAAGACWDKDKHARNPFAFSAVKLDLETGKGRVYVWSYSHSDAGIWSKDNKLYKKMKNGYWGFNLKRNADNNNLLPNKKTFNTQSESKSSHVRWSSRDSESLLEFIEQYQNEIRTELDEERVFEQLQSLKLVIKKRRGIFFTNAGALLFAKRGYVPMVTDVQLSFGSGQIKRFEKLNLFSLVNKLLDFFREFLYEKSWEDTTRRTENGRPFTINIYPREALQEAVINFVIHRDYEMKEKAYIDISDNFIVFSNSGCSAYEPHEYMKEEPFRPPYNRNRLIIQTLSYTSWNQTQRRGLVSINEFLLKNNNITHNGQPDLEIENNKKDNIFSLKIGCLNIRETMIFKKKEIMKPGELVPLKYRSWIIQKIGTLEPFEADADTPLSFQLQMVYQPLATNWLEPEKRKIRTSYKREAGVMNKYLNTRRPLADLFDLPNHRCFVLKGGPGSGKTTFLHQTAMAELDRKEGRLPLVLPLQKFGAWLAKREGEDGALVEQWAGNYLGKYALDEAALNQRRGYGVLWLLDGLDEIFDTGLRLRAAQTIGEWARGLNGADRLMATARPHALDQEGVRKALGMGETEAAVAALDRDAQSRFLDKWFQALYGPEQEVKAAETKEGLWSAMERHERIQELRDTPLLLSMLAAVYASGKKLPERRAALYEVAVWNLLFRRYGPGAGSSEAKARATRRGLMAVARGMIERGHVREIGRLEFVDLLAEGLGGDHDRSYLEELAEDLGGRSGLLSMKGSPVRYAFSHLGFQEYLAGRAYGEDGNRMGTLGSKLDDVAWKEVILLTAGFLCESGSAYIGAGFIKALKARYEGNPEKTGRLTLTMEAAAEAPDEVLPPALIEDLKEQALGRITSWENPPEEKERAVLGLALGSLGDPRLGMAKAERWVRFEPGKFTMGLKTHGNERYQPEHPVKLSQGYWLGRYPVTNQEYRAFVEAGGYGQEEWWSEEGWDWVTLEGEGWDAWFKRKGFSKELEENFQPGSEPKFWRDGQFNGPNQPVVGVSWYESEAYCRWLTARLETEKPEWWPKGGQVRLPSEAEWENAARGGTGRAYPWGNEKPDGQRANFGERLGQTSAVGIYPAGATPEGLWDMAGNVLEWCEDTWNVEAYKGRKGVTCDPVAEGDPVERALRGGSWVGTANWLLATDRDRIWSWGRDSGIGFRCLLSSAVFA